MKTYRAHAMLTLKSVDDEKGIIEGYATTPTPDRIGDIVEPKGAKFALPVPLLWQHDSKQPLGKVIEAKVTAAGIWIKAQVALGILPEIDRAWTLIKAGLVQGLSIGFRGLETADIKGSYAIRFIEWEWLELSAVTIPANAEASIQNIKAYDDQYLRAASGTSRDGIVRLSTSGAPETSSTPPTKGKEMTLREQIAAFEAKRAASVAKMQDIMKSATDAGETLSTEAQETYDALEADVGTIDKHLDRLRKLEKFVTPAVPNGQGADAGAAPAGNNGAGPVSAARGMQEPSRMVPAGDGVLRIEHLPKGIGMARYVKAVAYAKGNLMQAQEYAKQWDTSTPEVGMALKTAVAAGTTTDSTWAGPLVYNQDLASAFLDYLRPLTIIGKMQGISMVPFNIRYGIQSGGSTVAWVGQGAGKPVSKLQFTSGSLGFAKAAGIVVITQELARFSSPSAELKVRDDLTAQMRYFLDQQFIDPGVAAVANVSPASILNGCSNVRQAAAAWTTMAAVLTDVKALLAGYAANEISLEGAYWVMTPDTAMSLGMLLNTGGTAFAFPTISVNGGTFMGLPTIVSNAVPHSTSAGAIVALVVPQHILMADDGQVAIDTSTEASLQMDTAPTITSATPTAASLVSMFQTNSIAIRAERIINWARARDYGVGYIDNMHTS